MAETESLKCDVAYYTFLRCVGSRKVALWARRLDMQATWLLLKGRVNLGNLLPGLFGQQFLVNFRRFGPDRSGRHRAHDQSPACLAEANTGGGVLSEAGQCLS